MNNKIKLVVLCLITIIIILILKKLFTGTPLININNNMVRDLDNKEEASQMITQIKNNIKSLITHLKTKYPDKEMITRLQENFEPENIIETDVLESGTSYSINKGAELSICLRDKNDQNYKLHKLNTIMFVVIHELSHIMSKSYGHNEEFGDNFTFLLKEAQMIGVYSSENYNATPVNYCGIEINSNPLH